MKISILNNQVIEWIDLSHKWAEVFDIDDSYLWKLQSKTHYFDVESKEVVAYPIPEPVEPTEEELAEQEAEQKSSAIRSKKEELKQLILDKQTAELLWETLDDTITKIQQTAEEVIDLGEWTKGQKTTLKNAVKSKLLVNK